MSADVFTSATPTYRQAIRTRSHPMPLAAGEVAELPRSERWPPLETAVFMVVTGALVWAALFLIVGAVAQLKGF
jgi:hypothetical protein